MIDREYILWSRLNQLDRPVLNEEQHHSSWMFGDPATPILKAYIGDPVRIRFVHAGVKETHVFHLHLYEWHAVPGNDSSPRIDAISVSPQTAHTIEPLWGAGNRHQVPGDVIWHCHLYPHFHEGMWGMFRTFDRLQLGKDGAYLDDDCECYNGRRIGRYPNGTRIERLLPLPDRPLPPAPTPQQPGFPLFIPGVVGQKSPRPPWPDREFADDEEHVFGLPSLLAAAMPADFDYRSVPTNLERNAFNQLPVPGELFTNNPLAAQQAKEAKKFKANSARQVYHHVVVDKMNIDYNGQGWHDRDGHLFYLAAEGHPNNRPGPKVPLFFRAQHGQIVNLTLRNDLPRCIEETEFDPAFPPCPKKRCDLDWEGECAMHVHMVKFDPICADGASVGWNYMSGARFGKKMVYRWWADKEFGTIFFHDHLFANYRQKHGLFGALIVEPIGATFWDSFSETEIVSGLQARIKLQDRDYARARGGKSFREFCIGIGDFIPMWDRCRKALNPPEHPGGHGDQGVMALNYRNTPIRERLHTDPAYWFSSLRHGDPYTTLFSTYENEPLFFRVVQGSHEEQHSFQIHGMRWRRFRGAQGSALRNQQTFGIAEAFTFVNDEPYGDGDYLYKLSAADDLWLGCWGIIRSFTREASEAETGGLLPLEEVTEADTRIPSGIRRFHVVAEPRSLVYRDRGTELIDPCGLVYRLKRELRPGESNWRVIPSTNQIEPLVLRCRENEQVEVLLENRIPDNLRPERHAPEVPLEVHGRRVSDRVSMHADLVQYDVLDSDGANVGRNPEQTVPQSATRTYTWLTHRPIATDANNPPNGGRPLGPVLLQDMADFRNHRHHGLVGALIIEAANATPLAVGEDDATAQDDAEEAWHGTRATVVCGADRCEEIVLLLQDGLRLYHGGDVREPVLDVPAGEEEVDHEDQGQEAFNYRSEVLGDLDCDAPRDILGIADPATPVWRVPAGEPVQLHLVGACDKPRNHSFTIHGVAWREWRFLPPAGIRDMVSSESAITSGTVRTFEFTPEYEGDHAYRSGVLRWDVHRGVWGILRVVTSRRSTDPSTGS